ncbi:MAG: GNAT family N-acetyltransferase, partial [Chloroflexota bacterium]
RVTPTLQARADEPARELATPKTSDRPLTAERRAFSDIDPAVWDELAALNPWATPFSSWAFHRAWWDAYGENAHDETLVVVDPGAADPGRPVAIVPLMDRHVVEASDAATHTTIRHTDPATLTPVPPTACAVYFGASYHADYATVLAAPADLPRAAEALATAFANETVSPQPSSADPDHPEPWAAIDLRRLRLGDPAAEALATAFGNHEMAEGWTLNVEREDVCPVATIPQGADLDAFLSTLGKKERHEIRRKVRRAEAAGAVELIESTDPAADLEAFIDLHQARWGERGLFPPTPGGDQSRRFIRRLFELFGASGDAHAAAGWSIHLGFLTVAGRRIGAAIHFETADSVLYYNAGVDPEARDFSPGVVLLERLVRRAIDRGKTRFDLLRGNEPYKYEWGAVDEPIQRVLVRRTATLP